MPTVNGDREIVERYPVEIDIVRHWEVNCAECGVFDHGRTKAEARRLARDHRQKHLHDARRSWVACRANPS